MKLPIPTTVCVLAFVAIVAVHAKWATWDNTKKPPLSLSEALVLATDAITKHDHYKEHYCINAMLGQRVSDADWEFVFASTDKSFLWVNIAADGSAVVSKKGFFH